MCVLEKLKPLPPTPTPVGTPPSCTAARAVSRPFEPGRGDRTTAAAVAVAETVSCLLRPPLRHQNSRVPFLLLTRGERGGAGAGTLIELLLEAVVISWIILRHHNEFEDKKTVSVRSGTVQCEMGTLSRNSPALRSRSVYSHYFYILTF